MKQALNKNNVNRLHDPKTVAKFFGVHINTVYELIRLGELDALRLGKRNLRISDESVAGYLSRRKIKPGDLDSIEENDESWKKS